MKFAKATGVALFLCLLAQCIRTEYYPPPQVQGTLGNVIAPVAAAPRLPVMPMQAPSAVSSADPIRVQPVAMTDAKSPDH